MTIHSRPHVKPGVAWPMPGEVTLHTVRNPLPGHASSLPNPPPVSMLEGWLSYTSVLAVALSPTEGNNLHDSILGRVCAVASGAGFVRITSAKDEMMKYVTLGKTGLRVSVAGLGCGGNSRLGLGRGKTEAEAIALVRQALDMGLNLLDTAAAYGTEALIGKAIKTVPRDSVVITTKALINRGSVPLPPERVVASLESSLHQLDTDYIDVFQLHVVPPAMYDHAFQTIAPVLLREKEKGKFRALGITETSPNDHEQRMLQRAVHDTVWDVVMLGFN